MPGVVFAYKGHFHAGKRYKDGESLEPWTWNPRATHPFGWA